MQLKIMALVQNFGVYQMMQLVVDRTYQLLETINARDIWYLLFLTKYLLYELRMKVNMNN